MKQLLVVILASAALGGCVSVGRDPNLVFYSKLDSIKDIENPTVGAPGAAHNATFREGAVGNALYVPAHASVAEFPFPDGLPVAQGTIEFTARLGTEKSHFGVGGDPYYFSLRDEMGGIVFECHFNANNGCGRSGLICGMPGGHGIGSRFDYGNSYSSFLGREDTYGWHHYKIIWNQEGISGTNGRIAAYIDGKLISSGMASDAEWILFEKRTSGRLSLSFSTPTPVSSIGNSAFMIDEFKVWSCVIRE